MNNDFLETDDNVIDPETGEIIENKPTISDEDSGDNSDAVETESSSANQNKNEDAQETEPVTPTNEDPLNREELVSESHHDPDLQEKLEQSGLNSEILVFVDEDPLFECEWQVESVQTTDAQNPNYMYDKVYSLVRQYRGDKYSRNELKKRSRRSFAMLHLIMDIVRAHHHEVNPRGGVDYTLNLTEVERDSLQTFSNVMEKRVGKARIVTSARYGFAPLNRNETVKITVFEHSDPFETYQFAMEMLESLTFVSQRLETLAEDQHLAQSIKRAAPSQGYQDKPPTPMPQMQSLPTESNLVENTVDCWGDEDAQEAPPNSLLTYRATRIFYKDGKWSFYMPTRNNMQAGQFYDTRGTTGIYVYENSAPELFAAARADGRMPAYVQNAESVDFPVMVYVIKQKTRNGGDKYVLQDFLYRDQ